ncbi:DUF2490 domain-containing protein [Chitinophaga sp. GCM10012297]|uniref:DUF2490 domain-containing protein n=1 Tax=Chitinophaga chungangae TaxID=2821488 RepID=A0ABS3YF75_9BACT|nr:DUF2490 domain-containing protein [Chitinophaga chungangae]MBO9153331.1 DUF2490 domain-containing protein [Chitinophaga chungangae]
MRQIILTGILFLFTATMLKAQQRPQFAGWLASFNSFRITGSKFGVHLDAQARSSDKWESLQTYIVRPGLNYHVRKNMIITAGYALVSNRFMQTDHFAEHRIWEQFIINHPVGFVPLQHRFRVEQRFIGNMVYDPSDVKWKKDGHNTAHRFRYFLRGIIPFSGERSFSKGMFGALQNELFLNFGDKSAVNGKTFDQNRAYVAVGYRFSAKFDLEAGYLNQYITQRNDNFTNVHVAQLAGYLRL